MAEAAAREVQWRKVSTSVGKREPRVVRGVIVTGDVFVASLSKVAALRRQFQADAVEMEGAAVAQVCAQQGVPCLIIRSLSDKADSTTQMDLNQFGRIACSNSASLTLAILHRLATASP
jgi:adenosylhomocysteine nucleosidase